MAITHCTECSQDVKRVQDPTEGYGLFCVRVAPVLPTQLMPLRRRQRVWVVIFIPFQLPRIVDDWLDDQYSRSRAHGYSQLALDPVTIVGLVLGVLGLFGITLMYNLSKKVGDLLVRLSECGGARYSRHD